jgi:hypothetical protein
MTKILIDMTSSIHRAISSYNIKSAKKMVEEMEDFLLKTQIEEEEALFSDLEAMKADHDEAMLRSMESSFGYAEMIQEGCRL